MVTLPPNSPPYFVTQLQNITVNAGDNKLLSLPAIADPENDNYNIINILGSASSFTNFNDNKFLFKPLAASVGTHSITLVLSDFNIFNP